MDYNHIKNFLEKFRKIINKKDEVLEIVVQTIQEEMHCVINKNLIKIKNEFIFINTSPIFRSEILIHKKQILLKLKNKIPNINFLDIK